MRTMEYYSAVKSNELLLHTTTWMNLQGIMVHEKCQSLKGYILHNFIYIHFWNDIILKVIDRFPGLGMGPEKRQVWLLKGNVWGILWCWNHLASWLMVTANPHRWLNCVKLYTHMNRSKTEEIWIRSMDWTNVSVLVMKLYYNFA